MKSKLVLLALSSATSLIADGCCQPCEPCCTPQPRAPINCECYTPAFDDMQCDWDMFLDVEFLYWYGRENNLAYAIKAQTVAYNSGGDVLTPTKFEHLNTKWDPGVRVGLGWKMCDGWDLSAYWTYYHTEKAASTSVPSFPNGIQGNGGAPEVGNYALINPWYNLAAQQVLFDQVSAKWDFHINQIDLEMGRKYFLSKCFVMRPYLGLRGAWSHTHFHTESTATGGSSSSEIYDSFRNRNWGVGLLAGFQPSWYFDDAFSLFGEAGFALLWGKFQQRNTEFYVGTNGTFSASAQDNFFGMQPVVDLAIGIRWETNWCENRYAFALDAGWEHHIWFDYNTRTVYSDALNTTFSNSVGFVNVNLKAEEVTNNVSFGGFVLRARFDF